MASFLNTNLLLSTFNRFSTDQKSTSQHVQKNPPVFCPGKAVLGVLKSVRVLKCIPQWREDQNAERLPELPETIIEIKYDELLCFDTRILGSTWTCHSRCRSWWGRRGRCRCWWTWSPCWPARSRWSPGPCWNLLTKVKLDLVLYRLWD